MPTSAPARVLARLADLKARYGDGAARDKLEALRALAPARLVTAAQVRTLHEALCFLHAYPDDAEVFAQVDGMLQAFEARADLRAHRHRLVDSGIAGTDIVYPFHAPTARWLARRWGERLAIEWDAVEHPATLEGRLHLLALWSESPGLDEPPLEGRAWLDRLRGRQSDAAFVIERCAAAPLTRPLSERFYDELGLTLRLSPARGTPSRTRARFPRPRLATRTAPFRRERPDLRRELRRPPRRIRAVGRRDAEVLIDLARESMVTRSRDLYSFAAADPRDVCLVDCGHGLELACIGVVPEFRLLLEAVYSFLLLQNGVPIGYALASALFRSSEVAYNVFESFRGGEAAHVYGRLLAAVRALFGVDTFTVFPYQLGHENDEGLESGAWWFYYKLGFRPRDPKALALARDEERRAARRPGYRTSLTKLRALVRANVFLDPDEPRDNVIGAFPTGSVGLSITDAVAARFGSDRELAAATCADEAADRLGAGDWRRFRAGERLFWERWAPLIGVLPGVERWTVAEKRALVDVVRAKGGHRESDYVALFDGHARLQAALLALTMTKTVPSLPDS